MRRTFKYKAVINRETERNAFEWLYLCRTLYNLALEQRILAHTYNGLTLSCYTQCAELPDFKNEFPQFKKVGSQCLQDVLDRLDKAFKNFFRRLGTGQNPGFPRFKSRDRYNSFTLRQSGWKLEGSNLYIRNVGRFKLHLSRPVLGTIKTVTVIRSTTGNWFVTFSCDNVPKREFPEATEKVGIDVGLRNFCVDSDANSFPSPKYYRKAQKRLRVLQRSLARKQKGSASRAKARLQLAKQHEKVRNQRQDFLHKLANYYICNYGEIFVEDLKISSMLLNKYVNKPIYDAGWGMFFEMLSSKAEEAGRIVKKVESGGTSEKCSNCGEHVAKSISTRVHKCPNCGIKLDRDFNAALNIKAAGQAASGVTWDVGPCVPEESQD